jgi:hypothetical protein
MDRCGVLLRDTGKGPRREEIIMRLTLRTLLAYMEDRLPPASAREIGQKIARSPFSTELMERIREVLRKRRLAQSSHTQSTIDPNLIAEYLDDQLTPQLVARIEREFLSSDVALAEIAASYQILASLHESAPVDERLKKRLYDLDPSGRMEVVHALAESQHAAADQAPAEPATEWQPLAARVVGGRRLPTIIVAVMAFVWLGVVATDPVFFRGGENIAEVAPADGDDQPADDGQPAADEAGESDVAIADSDVTLNSGETGDTSDTATQTASQTPPVVAGADTSSETSSETADASDASDTPLVVKTSDPANAAENGDADMAAAGGAGAPQSATGDADAVVDPVAVPQVPVRMRDTHQATLVVNSETGVWSILRPGTAGQLDAGARQIFDWSDTIRNKWLAIPAEFESTLSVDGTGWTVRLLGPAIMSVNASQETSGLTLLTGRAMFQSTVDPAIADDVPRKIQLGTGPAAQRISLLTPDTVLGVAVNLVPPRPDLPQPPPAAEEGLAILPITADRRYTLYVVSGTVEIADGNGENAAEIQEQQSVAWTTLSSGEKTDVAMQNLAQPGVQPDWLFPETPLPEVEDLKSRVAQKLSAASDLTAAAVEESRQRNPQLAVLATGYLTVTRSIGPLMDVLLQAENEAVRRKAIDGLSAACAQTFAGFEAVRHRVETHLPQTDADVVLALLYGVSEEQARQPAFCAELVQLLTHDRLLIRELAFYRLETIVGDRYSYSADADPGRRREAVKRWQRHLDRNEGRLIP